MKFSVALLKIGNEHFTLKQFSSIKKQYNEDLKDKDQLIGNRIIEKQVYNNRWISLYFEEGQPFPRPENVYNSKTHGNEKNPREEHQIERNFQTFCLIDVKTQKIFISNFKKRTLLQEFLNKHIEQPVAIKSLIDKANFLSEIQTVKKIYLSASQFDSQTDFFSQKGILSKELEKDFHNYGTIEQMSVEIIFKDKPITEKLKSVIENWLKENKDNQNEKLQISGRYDDKFERVFNAEEIIDKIEIEVKPKKE